MLERYKPFRLTGKTLLWIFFTQKAASGRVGNPMLGRYKPFRLTGKHYCGSSLPKKQHRVGNPMLERYKPFRLTGKTLLWIFFTQKAASGRKPDAGKI
jgi:hypothetical protein